MFEPSKQYQSLLLNQLTLCATAIDGGLHASQDIALERADKQVKGLISLDTSKAKIQLMMQTGCKRSRYAVKLHRMSEPMPGLDQL